MDLGTYCIGGPAHSPHVLAQVRVAAGERIELALALPEGAYRLRGPQLPWSVDFQVEPRAPDPALGDRPGDRPEPRDARPSGRSPGPHARQRPGPGDCSSGSSGRPPGPLP